MGGMNCEMAFQLRPVAEGRRDRVAKFLADRCLPRRETQGTEQIADGLALLTHRGFPQPDQRLFGHFRRHTRMAVAVAADPGGKPQQWRHAERLTRIEFSQCVPQVPQHVGHHFPQHRHDAQPAVHLLHDGGGPGTDEVGLPELRQLGLELRVEVRGLARQQVACVEPLQ